MMLVKDSITVVGIANPNVTSKPPASQLFVSLGPHLRGLERFVATREQNLPLCLAGKSCQFVKRFGKGGKLIAGKNLVADFTTCLWIIYAMDVFIRIIMKGMIFQYDVPTSFPCRRQAGILLLGSGDFCLTRSCLQQQRGIIAQ